MLSRPRLCATLGCSPPRTSSVGFCGDFTPGVAMGGSSRCPCRSACSRNGPNSSPIQNVPALSISIDSGSKSNPVSRRAAGSVPQAAGTVAGSTLNVNGGRSAPTVGSQTVFHGDVPVRVAEQHGLEHLGDARRTQAKRHPVDRQLPVRRGVAGAIAVVGQRPPLSLPCRDCGADALYRLAAEDRPGSRRGHAVRCGVQPVLRREERAGGRRACPEGRGRQYRPRHELSLLVGGPVAGRCCNGGTADPGGRAKDEN